MEITRIRIISLIFFKFNGIKSKKRFIMRKLLITMSFLLPILTFGQLQNFGRHSSLNELSFASDRLEKSYANASGTRYLNKEFIPAKINALKDIKMVRFNAVENTIEVKQKDERIMTLSDDYSYIVELKDGSNRIYETLPYINEFGHTANTFFEQQYADSNCILYLKETIKFVPESAAGNSFVDATPARFIKGKSDFYVTNLEGTSSKLALIPKKKKKMKKLFKDRTDEVSKFMKKENLSLDNKGDLVKILNFYFAK